MQVNARAIVKVMVTVIIIGGCSSSGNLSVDGGLGTEADDLHSVNTDPSTGLNSQGDSTDTEIASEDTTVATDTVVTTDTSVTTDGMDDTGSSGAGDTEDTGDTIGSCVDDDSDSWCAEFDCDDNNEKVNRDAEELPDNNVDDNCDGETDESVDSSGSDSDGFTECAATSQRAEMEVLPADIVIVVDNSGSMTDEAQMVQDNLNSFSQQIIASGVDAHVVLISGYEDEYNNGICVEAPLGNGDCPEDTNLPTFKHVDRYISSHYGPKWATDEYDQWVDMLRPNGRVHFLFVSDDDPYQDAADFDKILSELEPPISGYRVHAIAADVNPEVACEQTPAGPCCEYAKNEGIAYKEMAANTGGIFGNLCLQEFQEVFSELATVVTELALECEWAVPVPPAGETMDKNKVNLEIIDDKSVTHLVGSVSSAADCGAVAHGWYYDDPSSPKSMRLCDQTCDWVNLLTSAEILVKFGCETQIAEPT